MFIKSNRLRATYCAHRPGARNLVSGFGSSNLKPASTPALADLLEYDPASPHQYAPTPVSTILSFSMWLLFDEAASDEDVLG